MIGVRILETIILEDKIWINCICMHSGDECAIYVEKTPKSRTASKGDKLWWQGRKAYWTPTNKHSLRTEDITGPVEIELERIGYSGAERPTASEVV